MIEAFGRVVVQGNYVVGAVVFAILTLVQLLVVAKGAERVAEVAARFDLDALPGKQMAIDADLRAGLIEAGEARRRRRALERESQLHGAMDGALKFVKGDAVAGVAIVIVNVAGGLVAGILRGMGPAEAARRYTVLAIGDGLVSQIPALLVAVAAGVAVTRVAPEEEGATLGSEIGRQLRLRDLGGIIVVDVTHATDFPGAEKKEQGDFRLGGGPVLARGSAVSRVVFDQLAAAAEAEAIPFAIEATPRYTSTDADAVYTSRGGVATGLVSVPCRYMHSPNEMVSYDDLDRTAALLAAWVRRLAPSTSFIPA